MSRRCLLLLGSQGNAGYVAAERGLARQSGRVLSACVLSAYGAYRLGLAVVASQSMLRLVRIRLSRHGLFVHGRARVVGFRYGSHVTARRHSLEQATIGFSELS